MLDVKTIKDVELKDSLKAKLGKADFKHWHIYPALNKVTFAQILLNS